MKTFILLILAILMSAAIYSQSTVSDDEAIKEITRITIATPTQINGGDTAITIPAPGVGKHIRIKSISFELLTGNTNYAGTGNDSTFVCAEFNSDRNKLIHIRDTYFIESGSKPVSVSGTFGIDENSPVWIDFASQYMTGNKPLKITSVYEIY